MKIQIFGTGCEKCTKLYAAVEKVIQQHGLEATLEKVSNIDDITAAGVMMTPALGVDGKIVCSGKIPTEADILRMLAPDHAKPCECHGEVSVKKTSRIKQLVSFALLAIVLASLGMMVAREMKRPAAAPAQSALEQKGTMVYFFHGNQRCVSCNRIEELTLKAIEGRGVTFKSVNLDLPENEHYVKDFSLESRIVVIQHQGKIKKMDEVWDRIRGDESEFIRYIQEALPKKGE